MSVCNDYISELNQILVNIKKSIIFSKPNKELITEFEELLESLKIMNVSDRKYDNEIQQYEKEIKNIKKQIDISPVNDIKYFNNNNNISILNEARDNLLCTEKVGSTILENLDVQNEKIVQSINKAIKINEDTKQSSKLTTKMSSWYHGIFK